jgi:hypothetical protein
MVSEAGCYLTFDERNAGTLYLNWSNTVIPQALAFLKPKDAVPKWKFTSNGGRSELIRGCNLGVGIKKHFEGWANFVKLAISMKAELTVFSDTVAIFLSMSNKPLVKVQVDKMLDVSDYSGVGCVGPMNDHFGEFLMDTITFVTKANQVGYGIVVNSTN